MGPLQLWSLVDQWIDIYLWWLTKKYGRSFSNIYDLLRVWHRFSLPTADFSPLQNIFQAGWSSTWIKTECSLTSEFEKGTYTKELCLPPSPCRHQQHLQFRQHRILGQIWVIFYVRWKSGCAFTMHTYRYVQYAWAMHMSNLHKCTFLLRRRIVQTEYMLLQSNNASTLFHAGSPGSRGSTGYGGSICHHLITSPRPGSPLGPLSLHPVPPPPCLWLPPKTRNAAWWQHSPPPAPWHFGAKEQCRRYAGMTTGKVPFWHFYDSCGSDTQALPAIKPLRLGLIPIEHNEWTCLRLRT